AQQQGREAAHSNDDVVGSEGARRRQYVGDSAALPLQPQDVRIVSEADAAAGAVLGEPGRELVAVADLVARIEERTDQRLLGLGQCRLLVGGRLGGELLENEAVTGKVPGARTAGI